jgi:hypothetical protein
MVLGLVGHKTLSRVRTHARLQTPLLDFEENNTSHLPFADQGVGETRQLDVSDVHLGAYT